MEDDSLPRPLKYALAVLAFAVFGLLCFAAFAHEAPTGWSYPYACCQNRDCAMIPAERVSETPDGGYKVVLLPGDHDMAPNGGTWMVPPRKAKPSPDGEAHLCISSTGNLLCFFIGLGSS